MVLENINSPEDVKKLSLEELNLLSGEMREALLHRLSNHGGHFGPTSAWWKPPSPYITCSTRRKTRLSSTCPTKAIPTRC